MVCIRVRLSRKCARTPGSSTERDEFSLSEMESRNMRHVCERREKGVT